MTNSELDAVPSNDDARTRGRRILVYSITVLAALLLFLTAANVWVKRQVLDTDAWVETSEEMLADDEIRAALSQFIVDELYATVDVTAQIESRLPEDLAGLAAPIAANLRGPAVTSVDRLLATPAAQEVWSRANRLAHETFTNIVKDDARLSVSTAGGTVSIDLRALVEQLAAEIGLPGTIIDRIPEGAGTITVFESSELETAQQAVTIIEWASVLLFILIVGLFGAAVALADGWRRVAVRNVGLAVLIVSLGLLVANRFGRAYVLDNVVAVPTNRPVVSQAWWIASQLLRDLAWSGVALGAAIVVAAVLVGPARVGVWLRGRVGPAFVTSPGVVWGVIGAALLVLVVVTPFDVFATGWGVLAAAVTIVGAVIALQLTCRRELALTPTVPASTPEERVPDDL